jgi:3-oxoacyl-[acyl-carrier protein] reductase
LVYSSSKAAIEQLTRVLAGEIGTSGVTVNAVGPTPIDTDLIKNVPANKIQDLIGHQSIKRLGKYEDVKNVIDFYLSPTSDFITGQVVYLGGIN